MLGWVNIQSLLIYIKEMNSMVEDIINIVQDNIINNNLIKKDDKIVVAVSGGPDSMCLLDSLFKLKDIIIS